MAHTRGAGLAPVLDGATLTETELLGYEFGMVGVPFVFASGDDRLKQDLAAPMPWVEYVVVKRATGYASADLLPVAQARSAIRAGVRRALENLPRMKPLVATPTRAGLAASFPMSLPPAGSPFSRLPGIEVRGDTVTFPARDYAEAYSRMQAVMGMAVPRKDQLLFRYLAARPDAAPVVAAVQDSVFDQLVPAFEEGRWKPGDPAPAPRPGKR